jgi:hypothetical protein
MVWILLLVLYKYVIKQRSSYEVRGKVLNKPAVQNISTPYMNIFFARKMHIRPTNGGNYTWFYLCCCRCCCYCCICSCWRHLKYNYIRHDFDAFIFIKYDYNHISSTFVTLIFNWINYNHFGRVWKIVKNDYSLSHVCPSAWSNSAATGRIFIKFGIWGIFRKSVDKIQVSLKSAIYVKNYIFLLRIRNVLDESCRETRLFVK